MNKTELINSISELAGVTKETAARVFKALTSSIEKSLKAGEPVTLVDFGNFMVSDRAAREGRNPSTGASIKIPASKVVRFKAGKGLKDAVKELSSEEK